MIKASRAFHCPKIGRKSISAAIEDIKNKNKCSTHQATYNLLISRFDYFIEFYFYELKHAKFKFYDVIIDLINILVDVVNQDVCDLIINLPPRIGKTELMKFFMAWGFVRNPECAFIFGSHSEKLAHHHAKRTRDILLYPTFSQLFIDSQIAQDSKSKGDFATKKGGECLAAGFGGAVLGRGAGTRDSNNFTGAIIISDPNNPVRAYSATERKNVVTTFEDAFTTRRNNDKVPIIIEQQRVHEGDLTGHILSQSNEYSIFIRKALDNNTSICEDVISADKLNKIRESNPYLFASKYQQNPLNVGDQLFPSDNFKLLYYLPDFKKIIITVDTAQTESITNDATALTAAALFNPKLSNGQIVDIDNICILDNKEIRVMPDMLESEIINFATKVTADFGTVEELHIESKDMGVMLLRTMRGKIPDCTVVPILRSGKMSKLDRLSEASTYVSANRVCLLSDNIECNDTFIKNTESIVATGANLHDDTADTLADLIYIYIINKIKSKNKVKAHINYDRFRR